MGGHEFLSPGDVTAKTAVRRFGRDVPGGQELVATRATGYDYTRTGKPESPGMTRTPKAG